MAEAEAKPGVLRMRVTRFRFALAWVFLGLAAVTGLGVAAFAALTTTTDAQTVADLRLAALVCPVPLAFAGAWLLFTCRSAVFDFAAGEVRIGGQVLPLERLRGVWLLASGNPGAGKGSRFQYQSWSLKLITDQAPPALLEALAGARGDLEGMAGDAVPAAPRLKTPGVLDALRAPGEGALIALIDAASEETVRAEARALTSAVGIPLLDMSDPRAPTFRR